MTKPLKLDDDLEERLLAWLRIGNDLLTAASCEGVDEATLSAWSNKATTRPRSRHGRFFQNVRKAEAQAQALCLAKIRSHAHWQAQDRLLGIMRPDRFGENATRQAGLIPIEVVHDLVDADAMGQALQVLAEAMARRDEAMATNEAATAQANGRILEDTVVEE